MISVPKISTVTSRKLIVCAVLNEFIICRLTFLSVEIIIQFVCCSCIGKCEKLIKIKFSSLLASCFLGGTLSFVAGHLILNECSPNM